jgi:toxin HigB-1
MTKQKITMFVPGECHYLFLDKCHESRYTTPMIKTFADKHTHDLFITGKSKKFQPDILKRAIRRLEYIDLATCIEDLKVPPSNHLHLLKDDRTGQYAISVNDQWRICFRFIEGDAYDVEITDYH